MKLGIMSTAAAIVALSTGIAAADCGEDLANFGKDYTDIQSTARGADRTNVMALRDLRDAAERLNAAGNQEACAAVVQAMHEVGDSARAAMEEGKASDTAGNTGKADATDKNAENDASDEKIETADTALTMEHRNARLVAVVDSDMLIDTGSLIGYNVYNYNDEFLGEIDGLLTRPGSAPSHMIVGHGGFLNIGDEEAAIPIDKMMWDPEERVFYVNMTEKQIENAPDYDLVNGNWVVDQNDEYYQSIDTSDATKNE